MPFFWVKFINAFCLFCGFVFACQMALLFNIYIYLNRVYVCIGKQGKYIFTLETFYLHGIFNNITKQDTYFLDCKHQHMMKSGAPPDKVGVLYRLFPKEFHGFTSRIDF